MRVTVQVNTPQAPAVASPTIPTCKREADGAQPPGLASAEGGPGGVDQRPGKNSLSSAARWGHRPRPCEKARGNDKTEGVEQRTGAHGEIFLQN